MGVNTDTPLLDLWPRSPSWDQPQEWPPRSGSTEMGRRNIPEEHSLCAEAQRLQMPLSG